jgi:protocatechuate 3,4-dioxygenase beta subunit
MALTRRDFVRLALALPAAAVAPRVAAAQGLDKFMTPSVPCNDAKPTPAAADATTYKPGSPSRAAIAPGIAGRKLVLTGTVSGVVCGPIAGAVVEFWQADAKGAYDAAGFTLRGQQRTNAMGVYRLETIVPAGYAGRAPHLNAKVVPAGKPTLTTQVFFPDDPANARDPQFKPELAMKVVSSTPQEISATFNFVLNV